MTCSNCTDSGCLSCNATDQCSQCIENDHWINEFSCQYCPMGQYSDQNGKTCTDCKNLCDWCNSTDYCMSCINNDTMETDINGDPGNCKCKIGFYLDGGSCLPCSDNCLDCNSTHCLACVEGMSHDVDDLFNCTCYNGTYFGNSTCLNCTDSGCAQCDDEDQCSLCKNEFQYIDTFTCTDCPGGEYSDNNGISCSSCSDSDCISCDGPDKCDQCGTVSNYLNGEICEPCPSGNFSNQDGMTCSDCGTFCDVCTTNSTCNTCKSPDTMEEDLENPGSCKCLDNLPYFDGSNCLPCGSHCEDCDLGGCKVCDGNMQPDSVDPNNCTCESSSFWNGTWCIPCSDSNCEKC